MTKITDDIILKFLEKLHLEGKSSVSIKNYKSDISHFLAWATLRLKTYGNYAESILEICPFINHDFFNEYKNYLVENKTKEKTINRRLSTLRNFSTFLYFSQLVDKDYMRGIQNVGIGILSSMQEKTQDIVDKFRDSLIKSEKVSANTVKNYVADVRSFLTWVTDNDLKKKDLRPGWASGQKGDLPNGS